MIFIRHRVNTIDELMTVDPAHGAEIDLRSNVTRPGAIHLSHDPWAAGQDFETWLDAIALRRLAGPLILNTKEDGLEERAMALMAARGLSNFFFLDTMIPTLVRWSSTGHGEHFCLRVSSAEPVASVDVFRGKVAWAWVDCFGGTPMAASEIARLKPHFRICLVSPELQKQPLDAIARFRDLSALADAICTKEPARWTY